MATVKVSIKNIDRLLYRFNKIAEVDLTDKVKDITTLVHSQAKVLAPVDTGDLAGSIHMEVKNIGNNIQGRVYTNKQYAPFVEFGTGNKGNGTYPYKIKGLSLKYRDTKWCYSLDNGEKFIWTNGQVAQPYMYPAIRRNRKRMKQILNAGMKEKLRKLCKGGQ